MVHEKKLLKHQILALLAKSRDGMTSNQIFDLIPDSTSLVSTRVLLDAMRKDRFVRTDGKATCKHCMAARLCWRITEQGRIQLRMYGG